MEAGKEVEYLYWVGCSASYDKRNQAIARSVVAILKKAGVSFAVMPEERCHGEVARRLGEEYLYQTVQQENVEAMKQYRFRKVITHCPHCFNTIKNEFPQFGGDLRGAPPLGGDRELIASGRICPVKPLDGDRGLPRLLLPGPLQRHHRRRRAAVAGRARAAGRSSRPATGSGASAAAAAAVTCGWRSRRKAGERHPHRGAAGDRRHIVGTACPFCLAMVDLGRKVKGAEETLAVKDVSELVADSLD